MQEYDLTDLDDLTSAEEPEWQKHDWTTQEVMLVTEFLRTGKRLQSFLHAFPDEYEEDDPNRRFKGTQRANRILARPHVRSYIAFIQETMKKQLAVNQGNVLQELAKLGYANMSDFVVLQHDGTPQFDISGLTRAQSAAIQEMTIDTYMDGAGDDAKEVKSVKVKLAPKIAALDLLGKHLKLFTDVIQTDSVSTGDLIRERRQRRRKAQEDGRSDGSEED
jgi:phage terminase small subunit